MMQILLDWAQGYMTEYFFNVFTFSFKLQLTRFHCNVMALPFVLQVKLELLNLHEKLCSGSIEQLQSVFSRL